MENLMTRIDMETLCKVPGKKIIAEINHNIGEFKAWRGKTRYESIFMKKEEEGIWIYNINSWDLDEKWKLAERRLFAKNQNPVFLPIGTEDYEKANKAYVGGTN